MSPLLFTFTPGTGYLHIESVPWNTDPKDPGLGFVGWGL